MQEDLDSTVESFDVARKRNNNTLVIAIVVIVVLCCCCIGSLAVLWYTGDTILEYFGFEVSAQLLQFI
jgi:hypothetical protein